jgi:hypothetical protein
LSATAAARSAIGLRGSIERGDALYASPGPGDEIVNGEVVAEAHIVGGGGEWGVVQRGMQAGEDGHPSSDLRQRVHLLVGGDEVFDLNRQGVRSHQPAGRQPCAQAWRPVAHGFDVKLVNRHHSA